MKAGVQIKPPDASPAGAQGPEDQAKGLHRGRPAGTPSARPVVLLVVCVVRARAASGRRGRGGRRPVVPLIVRIGAASAHGRNWDHRDEDVWTALQEAFPKTRFLHPEKVRGDRLLDVGGEPLWLIKAPKHSLTDLVAVFRGVAMTGDIETGTLDSVTDEVPTATRRRSMRRLRDFQERRSYHVLSTVSAHLNSVRTSVHWSELFECR